MEKHRCSWADESSAVYCNYHDNEWGRPVHDDKKLFEFLLLESFQAGLSWITILKKRESFRIAFDDFSPQKISAYDANKVSELMQNTDIVRNGRKITATIKNAGIFLDIANEYGSFSNYLWGFTKGETVLNPNGIFYARTELSDKISSDLYKRGMRFVGSVIIYSYLQAVGIVNDHEPRCYLYKKTK